MRRLLLTSFLAWACSSNDPRQAEDRTPPPEALVSVIATLEEAGLAAKGERLESLREFPGCPEAQFRYRLHVSGDFVNVSRFRAADEAKACLADFRSTVMKGGASAWERMAPDIVAHGKWLFFFPPEKSGHPLRQRILAALRGTSP